MHFDVVIKGGTVIDGLRSGRFVADVGIVGGRIAAIGGLDAADAGEVLDADGLIVAPGFIDLHTHYDSQIYWDPWCTISGWHGVTSVAIGNCGFGFAPCRPADRERAMLTMTRNEAVPLKSMQAGLPWDWETFPEFLDSLERIPKGVNVLSYAPLAPLYHYVMGSEAAKTRKPTDAELDEMCRFLKLALDAGACGFSAQILGEASHQRDYDGTPMVTDMMTEREVLAFAAVLRDVGRGIVQGLGGTQDLWNRVAEVSGRPVLFNFISVRTDQHGVVLGNFRDQLEWVRQSNLRGHRIFAQTMTCDPAMEFTLEDWNLFDSSPVWREATLGTPEERLVKLHDPVRRQKLKDEFDHGNSKLAMLGTGIDGMAGIRVHWVKDEALKALDYEGRTIGEIAERENKHLIDAFLDLAVADRLRAGFGTPESTHRDMEAMQELVKNPFTIPGISDGGAHTKFNTFGTYPTDYLVDLVREANIIELEEAHWHLSTLPAMAAGFKDRGYLSEGMPADIVVYDLDELSVGEPYRAYDYPADEWRLARKASGYRWILLNGVVTFEDDECTGATPGQLLRHGSAQLVKTA